MILSRFHPRHNLTAYYPKNHVNVILSPSSSFKCPFSIRFPNQNSVRIFLISIPKASPVYRSHIYFTTLILLGGFYKSQSFSLYKLNILSFSFTLSFLDQINLVGILISRCCALCSALKITEHVSHQCKIRAKITVLHMEANSSSLNECSYKFSKSSVKWRKFSISIDKVSQP